MAEPGALVGLYDLVKWYGERTERFPKPLRVTLGDRIDEKLLDMLETTIGRDSQSRPECNPRRDVSGSQIEPC